MKYKEKETGYEIEAVQYMTENKDEIVEFAGKNAVVEDGPDGLDITWGEQRRSYNHISYLCRLDSER